MKSFDLTDMRRNQNDVIIGESTMKPERIEPGPGQESVWDYPRPPQIEDFTGHVRVISNSIVIADTQEAKRVLETSHPPVYYIHPSDILMHYLMESLQTSWCEFKGHARYYMVAVNEKEAINAAWYYPDPAHDFLAIKDHVAFYPGLMDA
ncbi:MAG: DUF427 domain-containing protein [Nitrospiraceae bacterium]|nr:MAG: DUF427 domain-containing protein [Nitrospiraceae bacterium]